MARFRKHRRHSARSASRGFKRSRRGRGKGDGGLMMRVGGAAVYGAVRAKVSNALAPYTSKIPAGSYADELGMGLAAYLVGRFLPAARPVTNAAMMIEASRIGQKLASGNSTSGTSAVSW